MNIFKKKFGKKDVRFASVFGTQFKEFLFLFFIFVTAIAYSLYLDLGSSYAQGVFLWDSKFTSDLAENWKNNLTEIPVEVVNPFNSRILYPSIYGAFQSMTGISLIQAALFIDCIAIFFTVVLLWRFLKISVGVNTWISGLAVIFYLFSYNFPLRQTVYMPGNGWAFPIITTWIAYFALQRCERSVSWYRYWLFSPVVLLASMTRELFLLLVFHLVIVKIFIMLFKIPGHEGVMTKFFMKFSILRLIGFGSIALSVQIYLNFITRRNESANFLDIFRTYFGKIQQVDLVNIFLTLFSTIGIFMIPLLIVLSRKFLRNSFKEWLSTTEVFPISLFMVLSNLLMMLYGGADWPRFLTWGFPFYLFFTLGALKILFIKEFFWKSKKLYAVLILISLLSMRVYVPAGPMLFFPNADRYCSAGGWKTDYSATSFRGLGIIKSFRFPTSPVPKSDLLALNGYQVKILDKKWIGLIPEVPYEATRCVDGNQFIYSNAYRLEINNLPFPFGFPTNQYEYNALLPFYGNKEIQSVYIAQWILLYLIMQRLTNRRVNSP